MMKASAYVLNEWEYMLLQYNMRGLFIRNYHQLDYSLTHVLMDSAKLEFRLEIFEADIGQAGMKW